MGRILAIDYGQKRIGIAATDPEQIIANGLDTVSPNEIFQFLSDYFAKETVDEVVIGHPYQLNGEDSESMQYIQPFINRFRKVFPHIPLKEYDERFTSVIAHQAMIAGGMKKSQRKDKAVVDKIAACIILEGYMDSIKNF